MTDRLSKDADIMLCLLYKEYCQRIKNGSSNLQAKMFGGAEEVKESFYPKTSLENVNETLNELSRAGIVIGVHGDGIFQDLYLTDLALAKMENRFADGIHDVLDYLAKIRSILPL